MCKMDSSFAETLTEADLFDQLHQLLQGDGGELGAEERHHQELIQSLSQVSLKDFNLDQRQLLQLCRLAVHSTEWLGILFRLIDDYSITSSYVSLHPGDAIEFQVHGKVEKSFTIQTWLQINSQNYDEEEEMTIIKLGSFLNLSIEQNKLKLRLVENSERQLEETFDSFNFEVNVPYHMVLLHSSSNQKYGSKFSLYIDGEFIQSVQIDADIGKRSDISQVALCNHVASGGNRVVDFVNLLVINEVQSWEWILLSYYLSPDYCGNYMDTNLTEALSYRSKNFFELKLKELYVNSTMPKNGSLHDLEPFKFEDFSRQELLKFEQIHNLLVKSGKLSLEKDSILLNFNSKNAYMKNSQLVIPYDSKTAQTTQSPSLWTSLPIQSVLYSIGGITIAFKMVELSSTNDHLCLSINFLFEIVSKDWRNLKEFEMKNGYDLLATLLKTKKSLIDLNVLDIILKFIGYDFNSPIDSVLMNPFAYRSLILDFDIWKLQGDTNVSDKETFKFLLFQFTVFFQESKYSLYNINKLVKMRVIKRFIQALKSDSFGKDMLTVVHSSLLILIKANPSSEIMKSLSLYIIYALNKNKSDSEPPSQEEPLQRECGICALDVLVSYVCDSSLVSSSLSSASASGNLSLEHFYKKLAKTISVRWILLLLEDSNRKVIKLALRLLIRMLSISGPKYYTNFMNHSGLDILTTFLQKWWSDNEILVILFSGAFAISQVQGLSSDLSHFANRLSKRGGRLNVVMPEFLYLVNKLLIYGVDTFKNSIEDNAPFFNKVEFDLASAINSYVDAFEITCEKVPCLFAFYSKDQTWINSYLHIICRLELLPLEMKTLEITSATNKMIEKFANLIIELLLKKSNSNVEFFHFENSIQDKSNDLSIFQTLISPKIMDHLINFKDVLAELIKSQKWLKNNVIRFLTLYGKSVDRFNLTPDLFLKYLQISNAVVDILCKNNMESEGFELKKLVSISFLKAYLSLTKVSSLMSLTKDFLFRQEVYLNASSLKNEKVAELIVCIYKNCHEFNDTEFQSISINALRMILLYRQNDLERIVEQISFKDRLVLKSFCDDLLSSNDTEVIESIQNNESLLLVFDAKLISDRSTTNHLLKADQSYQLVKDSKSVASFEQDNVNWQINITTSESSKFFRHIQDYEDNLQFYISIYNKMRQESTRSLYGEAFLKMKWVVDSIECDSRMRRRIVPELSKANYKELISEIKGSDSDLGNGVLKKPNNLSTLALESTVASMNIEESFEIVEDPGESEANQEDKNRKVLRSLYVGDKIVGLWNISQIFGLDSVESIFILGNSHLYIVENYFHSSNGEIMDINDAPVEERDPYMQLILGPKQHPTKDRSSKITKSWSLEKFTSVSKRQFLLRDVALEFFFNDGSSFLLTCINQKVRDSIHSKVSHLATWKGIDQDLSQALKLSTSSLLNNLTAPKLFGFNLSNAFNTNLNSFALTKKWQRGEISNFYYLIIINTLAGRTFNDLTQYPVFPWVIADYTSEILDLQDPKSFRDLTKPMGGQGSQREATFIERYEALASLNDCNAPPFHYGTHYSSAMIVTHFLIRLEPYVQSYLLLQGGKFDHADRLFYSVSKAWQSALKENTTDVRELIPEFFYLPEFLTNSNKFDFGRLQDGTEIGDVVLPPWAKGDPKIFVQKNREALESPYVSSHLHEWIDLIFGFKQTGKAAVESTNVFHHLSYNGAIDLDKIEDEVERRAMTGIIHNFGQTPLQIFQKPHPEREVLNYPRANIDLIDEEMKIVYEAKAKFSVKSVEMSSKDSIWKGRPKIFSNHDDVCIRGCETIGSLYINGHYYENLHSSTVNSLVSCGQKQFLTGCQDGTIHVWKYINKLNPDVLVSRKDMISAISELRSDSFEFQAVLRGHISAIVDIKVSISFNAALSLDENGDVILWDLVRLAVIRRLEISGVTHVLIANDTGNIALLTSDQLHVLSINGESIASISITSDMVNCIEFGQSNWPSNKKENHHEYWQRYPMIVIGRSGSIEILQLKSDENEWELQRVRVFDTNGVNITAVKLLLISELDDEGNKSGRCEIVCGDDQGRVVMFK